LRWTVNVCRTCGLPLPGNWNGAVCGKCLLQKPVFATSISACSYQYPVDRIIARYKYGGQEWLARGLGTLLTNRLHMLFAAQEIPRPDLIIPVPLHIKRLLRRGFNQAHTLGQVVAHSLAIPIKNNVCVRQLETREQTGLSEGARHANMRGAFALRTSVTGQNIAIVDDVITTGSTVGELAKVLLKGGAHSVQCWSVARAVN